MIFVLTHKGGFEGDMRHQHNIYSNSRFGAQFLTPGPPQLFRSPRVKDDSKVCHYCQKAGHWKDLCPVLRSKNRRKPFVFAPAPILSHASIPGPNVECVGPMIDEVFEPFVTDAVVSLVGGGECVRIKVFVIQLLSAHLL